MKNPTLSRAKIIFAICGVILTIVMLMPFIEDIWNTISHLLSTGSQEDFQEYLRSFGMEGIIIIFVIQIIQVVTLIIPAPLTWVAAGLTYGVFTGLLICIAGLAVGNTIAFIIGKWLGKRFPKIFESADGENKRLAFLMKGKRKSVVLFLLYVIPGVPNAIVPYIYGGSGGKLRWFLPVVTLASVPAILLCTAFGGVVFDLPLWLIITIAIIIVAGVIILFINRKKIMALIEKLSGEKKIDKEEVEE